MPTERGSANISTFHQRERMTNVKRDCLYVFVVLYSFPIDSNIFPDANITCYKKFANPRRVILAQPCVT